MCLRLSRSFGRCQVVGHPNLLFALRAIAGCSWSSPVVGGCQSLQLFLPCFVGLPPLLQHFRARFQQQFESRSLGRQPESLQDHLNHAGRGRRSEEHTSELQSLMRISYAVFCLKKKNDPNYNCLYCKVRYESSSLPTKLPLA